MSQFRMTGADLPDRAPIFTVVEAQLLRPTVRHLVGLPPEVTGGEDGRQLLPWPLVLVIQEDSEGNVFLYRVARNGAPGGDTWHASVDDAKAQAAHEYGELIGAWSVIPVDVGDAHAFALATARARCVEGS